MKYKGVQYIAFGEQGEYTRDARTIGELPGDKVTPAIEDATKGIESLLGMKSVKYIAYGIPVYEVFGMRPADAKKHPLSKLLMTRGSDVPLNYCG